MPGMKHLTWLAVGIAAIILFATIAACGYNDERGRGDAPVGHRDDSKATIINMPDKFANISFKCIGPNGLYVTTREAPPVVVKDDQNCSR